MPRRPLNERSVASVLFTDIGGSTELASRVGDLRWREILKAHHALVRRALKRFGGREVDTAGDGFFALFDQPARAVGCAVAIVEGVERLGLQVRAGVHVGEVEPMGNNVGGIAVHIGARGCRCGRGWPSKATRLASSTSRTTSSRISRRSIRSL
jgi:class 3 adenylate cyclase